MLTLLFPSRQFRLALWLVALLLLWGSTTKVHAVENPSAPMACNWRGLKSPSYIWPGDGAIYFSFATKHGSRANLIVIDTNTGFWSLKPYLNETTAPTSATAEKIRASAATNGGYFNLSNGESTSYVVIDGKVVANPRNNQDLIKNTKLQPFIEAILNRSEIRFLSDRQGKTIIKIAPHDAPVTEEYRLVDSLQAGPQLLPELTARQEAFLRTDPDGKEVDAISVNHAAARTAFGITSDGYAMLLTVADSRQDPESAGVTIPELAEIMRDLGCSQAINLDGGASTTMLVRPQSATPDIMPPGNVVCGKTPETRVKSVLYLYHTENIPAAHH